MFVMNYPTQKSLMPAALRYQDISDLRKEMKYAYMYEPSCNLPVKIKLLPHLCRPLCHDSDWDGVSRLNQP